MTTEITHIGFDVYAEREWRGVHCFPRPTMGGMKLHALGVENYVYTPFTRGDAAKYHGARPMLPARFLVSEATLACLREEVRAHLARIDRGEVSV